MQLQGMTNSNFHAPQDLLEESMGNLDAKGTTTSHWMQGNFDKSSNNFGGKLDALKEKSKT
jgi:hypothetical protein